MTLFWGLAGAMTVLAIVWLVVPLWRQRHQQGAARDRQNIEIARERLAELAAERDRGELNDEAYEQARRELELALADDLAAAERVGVRGRPWVVMLIVILLVPALTVVTYDHVGSPEYLGVRGASPEVAANPHGGAGAGGPATSVAQLIEQLEARLEREPDNQDGWYMLGRSHMALGDYPQAVAAFERLYALAADVPAAVIALADAIAMTQDGRLAGRPDELVQEALALDPGDATVRWLAGQAAEEQGNHALAIEHWYAAETLLADEPDLQTELRRMMTAAAQAGGGLALPDPPQGLPRAIASEPPSVAAVSDTPLADDGGPSLLVSIALSSEATMKLAPDTPVFVFARAVDGPPMPLAAARLTVADLPTEVTLDDSLAMMPGMQISSFPEVKVMARASLSGQPGAQSGDWESADQVVAVAAEVPVDLRINRQVP